jgi:hypothetical protein
MIGAEGWCRTLHCVLLRFLSARARFTLIVRDLLARAVKPSRRI